MRSFLLAIAACLMFCAAADAQSQFIYQFDSRGNFSYGYVTPYGYVVPYGNPYPYYYSRPPCRRDHYTPYRPERYEPYRPYSSHPNHYDNYRRHDHRD